jgi:hypothetical protein
MRACIFRYHGSGTLIQRMTLLQTHINHLSLPVLSLGSMFYVWQ